MEVDFALLCDGANVSSEGKLNILGTFDRINASTFPTVHPMMQLVLRLSASVAEAGMSRELVVHALNEDGERIGGMQGTVEVPERTKPGRRVGIQLLLPLRNTLFPKPGEHAFHILIGQDEKAVVPLSVVQSSSTEEVGP